MKLIVFSKYLQDKSVEELAELAGELGVDGYDLCVRPGHPVNPDNAAAALPEAARRLQRDGLSIPMVTANFDVLLPDHPTAEPILAAMDGADIRLLKLGYFQYDPLTQDFWAEVERIRGALAGWAKLAGRYDVTVCYHTHSDRCFSSNASMLAHLVRGFDPRQIGAYLDPAHLVVEGEEFAVAAAVLAESLRIVSVKDVLLTRVAKGAHGAIERHWVEAGAGMVDWTEVFATLERRGYDGPVSVHCEFDEPADGRPAGIRRETAFFRQLLGRP